MIDVLDQINEEDLTPDLQMLASVTGIEPIRQLLRNFAGMSFYVPKVSRFDTFIIKYIKKSPDKSLKILALELGVSEQYLKTLKRRFHESFRGAGRN